MKIIPHRDCQESNSDLSGYDSQSVPLKKPVNYLSNWQLLFRKPSLDCAAHNEIVSPPSRPRVRVFGSRRSRGGATVGILATRHRLSQFRNRSATFSPLCD
ncbi:hypothetical protein L798_09216 [Zootermopsis nevadensis]|uniref:Uncharacterized protein n=1 Tax=Zootermopsis nevadensis TaxID=136037 RepID=A0A067RJ96_ZOONE|nr:hypothetical protein L798_09216 [Zootermopsis nevadensis]